MRSRIYIFVSAILIFAVGASSKCQQDRIQDLESENAKLQRQEAAYKTHEDQSKQSENAIKKDFGATVDALRNVAPDDQAVPHWPEGKN
jgi:hypothetical protein